MYRDSGVNCVFFSQILTCNAKDLTIANDAGHRPEDLARRMGQHHLIPLFLGAADMVMLLWFISAHGF